MRAPRSTGTQGGQHGHERPGADLDAHGARGQTQGTRRHVEQIEQVTRDHEMGAHDAEGHGDTESQGRRRWRLW